MELRPEEITKIIRSQIKNYENKIEVSETGVVILVGDGIANNFAGKKVLFFQRRKYSIKKVLPNVQCSLETKT